MEIFLVGGAVRDELLGRPVKERDWVVVGATPEALIALQFQPVGKDFPVFLHPLTHEEYALARSERKISKGYKGFQFYASPEVTLLEDLKRRDLTINAMAKSEKGELIDPYGGQQDIKARVLRHVSPAFSEDPVRILRVARFATMLPEFHVHPETNTLMQKMVSAGEVDALVAERVWKELSRALANVAPHRFFDVLEDCHALPILFPELSHESNGLLALKRATTISDDPAVRFAALFHFMHKDLLRKLCKRYRIPNDFTELALLTAKYFTDYEQINVRDAKAMVDLLRAADAFRRENRFFQFILACRAIHKKNVDHTALFHRVLKAAQSVDTQSLVNQQLTGEAFGRALIEKQIEAVKNVL